MDISNLTIATITLVRNDVEEQLLKQSLQVLSQFQIPIVITDGGSKQSFVDFLRALPNVYLAEGNATGVFAQVKSSLLLAGRHQSKYILYTEPDKFHFFKNGLSQMINHAEENKNFGILTASRNHEAFKTFPAFQQITETTINKSCAEITGKNFDYTYGPFLMHSHLAENINTIKLDIGWGWRPFMFMISHRLGLVVNGFDGSFNCPLEQQGDDLKERIYRMKQLEQNMAGIVLGASIDLP